MEKKLKVLILNGSPRANGNTSIAVRELQKVLEENNVEAETIQIGKEAIRGCVACGYCGEHGKCVFKDAVNEIAPKFEAEAVLDRLFFSTHFDKTMKVGASIACARRAGTTATFDELNKYFTISNMPVVSSQYWNNIHGMNPGDAEQDGEGKQTMRTLARNMVFLMKSIALGKEKFGLPEKEEWIGTHFIR